MFYYFLSFSHSDLCSFVSYVISFPESLLFWNNKLLFWAFFPPLVCFLWYAFMVYRGVIRFFFFFFFPITLYGTWPQYFSVFHFYMKNSFLELLRGRVEESFFKFIELRLLLSCSQKYGSLFSDASWLGSPHLLWSGPILSFVSITSPCSILTLLPAVFTPG